VSGYGDFGSSLRDLPRLRSSHRRRASSWDRTGGNDDYFNTTWCPQEEYSAPYHGITLGGEDNWGGHVSLYRFHVEDPVTFERSIRVTIEHGHANKRSDDYSSVAYWYQAEPHRTFSILLVEQRIPRQP